MTKDITEHNFIETFRDYGEILDYSYKVQYGFITFRRHDDARKAIKELNGRKVFSKYTNLLVEWAHGREIDKRQGNCFLCKKHGHIAKVCRTHRRDHTGRIV